MGGMGGCAMGAGVLLVIVVRNYQNCSFALLLMVGETARLVVRHGGGKNPCQGSDSAGARIYTSDCMHDSALSLFRLHDARREQKHIVNKGRPSSAGQFWLVLPHCTIVSSVGTPNS
jgi:hypothetical protein